MVGDGSRKNITSLLTLRVDASGGSISGVYQPYDASVNVVILNCPEPCVSSHSVPCICGVIHLLLEDDAGRRHGGFAVLWLALSCMMDKFRLEEVTLHKRPAVFFS